MGICTGCKTMAEFGMPCNPLTCECPENCHQKSKMILQKYMPPTSAIAKAIKKGHGFEPYNWNKG